MSLSPIDVARFSFEFNKGYNSRLERKYTKLQKRFEEHKEAMTEEEFLKQKKLKRAVKAVTRMLPKFAKKDADDPHELYNSLEAHSSAEFAAADLLIPTACKKNRIHFENLIRRDLNFLDRPTLTYPVSAKIKAIAEKFKEGRSMVLAICTKKYASIVIDKIEKLPEKDFTNCADHNLIADGIKWNKELKRCEIQLKNTWGEEGVLSGWVSADEILPFVTDGQYLTEAPKAKDSKPSQAAESEHPQVK